MVPHRLSNNNRVSVFVSTVENRERRTGNHRRVIFKPCEQVSTKRAYPMCSIEGRGVVCKHSESVY